MFTPSDTWAELGAAVPKARAAAAIAGTNKFHLRIKSPRQHWKGNTTCRLFLATATPATFRHDHTKKVASLGHFLVTVPKFAQQRCCSSRQRLYTRNHKKHEQ